MTNWRFAQKPRQLVQPEQSSYQENYQGGPLRKLSCHLILDFGYSCHFQLSNITPG
jgi:hypothetical protein